MKIIQKIFATFLVALASLSALGQTYPSPTYNNLTVNGSAHIPYSLTFNNPAANTVYGKLNQIVNFTDFNPTCNGSTNDNTAWTNAISALGNTPTTLIISCPTKISSNLTFAPNTQVRFDGGGEIIGTSGSELVQFQQQIIAGRTQILSNVTSRADVGMTVFPDWWGASINATDNSGAFNLAMDFLQNVGGRVDISSGTFNLTAPVSHFHRNITLWGSGPGATVLQTNGTNINGITVIGVSGTPISNVTIGNFNLISSTPGNTNTGVILQYTAMVRMQDMQVTNYFQSFYMQRATNSFFYRMGGAYTAATNGFVCWYIDGGGTGAGGNASSTWRDTYCQGSAAYGGPTGQVAYRASGAYVSDLYFSNASAAQTNYGYYFDYSSAMASSYADVIIQNPIVDGFTAQAIFITGLPEQQMITVMGGWLNPVSVLAETDALYVANSVGSATFSNMQIGGEANYAYAVGARIINSSGVRITGSTFNDNTHSIYESGTSARNVYTANLFHNTSAHAGAQQVYIDASSGSMVNGNAFDGYAANSVVVNSGSTAVGVVANTFASTVSAPHVYNLSAGAIGGSSGSTGLNSGY